MRTLAQLCGENCPDVEVKVSMSLEDKLAQIDELLGEMDDKKAAAPKRAGKGGRQG